MVDLNAFPIFSAHPAALKETSADERKKGVPPVYMTESTLPVINFDEVKGAYIRGLSLSETPKSVDALFMKDEHTPVFVEFKNGRIGHKEQYSVRKKIYDSLLIFSDITSLTISDLRERMEYILVYNETANPNQSARPEKDQVQVSPSFDTIAKTFRGYAQEEYVCFGLKDFQRYCFKAVHTYTQAEFESYLAALPRFSPAPSGGNAAPARI